VVEEDVDVGRRVAEGENPAVGGERAAGGGGEGGDDNPNTYPKISILPQLM